ncbi:periplasmic nitrate reductase, NapE protein [Maritimibacter sp. UBA3975]|uniref:periplasmic nitrate reductase, NapE protein n=1 Tax=Maritimibacter sp. UBA3975 TaxID=1946833 RepID=UPI000C0B5C84|nr:periplasmic nitrate reductase, NapE protein [Maritimibacter sp. UBA3975]MAM63364.1 periplasmic nitrate reductase, NapE protein [Maritimibacter sp.]|tara:strand:- start:113829 stop:114002 length:174 start_codon:yes stop_codon:yes gene_type:complete
MNNPNTSEQRETSSRGQETVAFLFLALVLFPILAVIFVGGFGFVVWMEQLLFGPPGS